MTLNVNSLFCWQCYGFVTKRLTLESRGCPYKVALYLSYLDIKFNDEIKWESLRISNIISNKPACKVELTSGLLYIYSQSLLLDTSVTWLVGLTQTANNLAKCKQHCMGRQWYRFHLIMQFWEAVRWLLEAMEALCAGFNVNVEVSWLIVLWYCDSMLFAADKIHVNVIKFAVECNECNYSAVGSHVWRPDQTTVQEVCVCGWTKREKRCRPNDNKGVVNSSNTHSSY